jgi:hypothetical protein
MNILASGPELQAVRFGYVILGKEGKKISSSQQLYSLKIL